MRAKNLLLALRAQNPLDLYRIMSDWHSFVRMHFLHAAIESGLLEALETTPTRPELIAALDVKRPEILDALLEIGLALREVACESGRYRIAGRRSRSLCGARGDPLRALIQANATYYNSAYRHAAARLRGAPLSDELAEIGDLVARASRIAEPFLRDFVEDRVAGKGPMRILEVGCGSGVFLRCAAEANPEARGVGVDMDPDVVDQAQDNLKGWGVDDRFRAVVADVRVASPETLGPFDLVTMYNVIYYFSLEERRGLLRRLRSLLTRDGVLAIVSSVRGARDVGSAHLNLATSSLQGCTPLPDVGEISAQLRECGFERVETKTLVPGSAVLGISARAG